VKWSTAVIYFEPKSSAIQRVGYVPQEGTVIQYVSGAEFLLADSDCTAYNVLRESPSVGAQVAFFKDHGTYAFIRNDGHSYFPTRQDWVGESKRKAPPQIKVPSEPPVFHRFLETRRS